MARIIENKLLFIHTPKTGGTFIRECINALGIPNWETGLMEDHDHMGIIEYNNLRHLHSFGCIREPYEYIKSRHAWAKYTEFGKKVKGGTIAKKHWMAEIYSDDIEEFINGVINKRNGIVDEEFYNKLRIKSPGQVDTIVKTENLKQELKTLFEEKMQKDISSVYDIILNKKETKKDIINDILYREKVNLQNKITMSFYK